MPQGIGADTDRIGQLARTEPWRSLAHGTSMKPGMNSGVKRNLVCSGKRQPDTEQRRGGFCRITDVLAGCRGKKLIC